MNEFQKKMIENRDELNVKMIKSCGLWDITPYAKIVCKGCRNKHKGLDEDGSHMTTLNPFTMTWDKAYYCDNPYCDKISKHLMHSRSKPVVQALSPRGQPAALHDALLH